ncbi:hypothetical protein D3C80_2026620 [compost metagenome]
MNDPACARLAIAAVSVISKQMPSSAMPARCACSRTNSGKWISASDEPDRLMAQVAISPWRPASARKAVSTTQRSIIGIRL